MKKDTLKLKFVELRGLGYTFDKICKDLNISKPTAIKWSKLYEDEINQQQKFLMSKIFSEKIFEQEQGILIKLEQFRRGSKMNLTRKIKERLDRKTLKGLEKIFLKKITAIHLTMTDDYIKDAIFIFDDDAVVERKKE